MSNIVKINNLTKIIKGNIILDNIDLEIKEGLIYGIIGRNGSGKSMLFKSICGLISPTEGSIEVFDNIISKGKFPKNFGVLLDSPGFIPEYSAFKNLKLLASINNKVTDEQIIEIIIKLGLDPYNEKPVKKFSLGMKQRLGIAQSIMESPKLLVLDEPMNGLDEQGVHDIRDLILDLKQQGVTIILSSHNSEDINVLCDLVYKIDNGKLVKFKNEKEKTKSLG
ncbi:ABC transporter ATP-binding protein [Fictibacillus sp. 23RED33]|uniref:ABC transporter ATP-binding protein n=1 Tax=Fictibacillus sp. 23RED33 TaxID=2745879 RepID=UPI0018CFE7BC|nr:ABC transporter ATP-binding protein [Fictibacillus sp. 23RED33]MBH0176248.1 ABC transporter ATP-binding protein [Fictibacillus sp. 23RED33]